MTLTPKVQPVGSVVTCEFERWIWGRKRPVDWFFSVPREHQSINRQVGTVREAIIENMEKDEFPIRNIKTVPRRRSNRQPGWNA